VVVLSCAALVVIVRWLVVLSCAALVVIVRWLVVLSCAALVVIVRWLVVLSCAALVVIVRWLAFSRPNFEKYSSHYINICVMGSELFHADGRTDMTKSIAFRNFGSAPKKAV
jgi:hypothetical protein